jgi:hypothetical protein
VCGCSVAFGYRWALGPLVSTVGRGRDERRPRDALGGEDHQSQRYARPVGEADEGDGRAQAEAVEDVLGPEGVPVALRRGPDLRAPARLTDDVRRVEAVALRQRQEPLKAGGVQEVAARQEDRGRGALVSDRDHVGVAEACADGQALFTDAQPGERLVVERLDLGLALGRPVDGSRQRASPPDTLAPDAARRYPRSALPTTSVPLCVAHFGSVAFVVNRPYR